jgi:hypothetical protein
MNLIHSDTGIIYFENADYLQRILNQIQKDFEMTGLAFDVGTHSVDTYSKLYKAVFTNVSNLIDTSNTQFKNLLYRIDVSEMTIHKKMALRDTSKLDEVVSKLIIERCLLKVLTREKFSG